MSAPKPTPPPAPEEVYTLLMENVEDYAIFTLDTKGCVSSWNKGAERLLGYREPEILGQSVDLIFTPEDCAQGVPRKELKTAKRTGRAQDDRWHLKKEGSRFFASGSVTALYDAHGKLRAYVKILRDFTEQKHYEEEIERLNLRLQQAMTEAHHRIKNSLQVVASLVDLQTQEQRQTVPVAEVRRIGQHLHTMAALHELLTEEIKTDVQARGLSVTALLENLLPLLQQMVGARPLQCHLAEIRLPSKQGTALAREGERVLLEVCDEGPGFPEGFEAREAAHTGLELVETLTQFDLSGEVLYETLPEGGARVRIRFPLPAE
jgi:PAS domain S-box-containing protein